MVATAARALVSSGLLSPPAPVAVLRLIREVYRGGTNLYTLLAIAAARWPDRTAIIDDDGALSYRELQSKTESLARELYRDGRWRRQAVGIMCRNGRDFVAAVFAAALVGADVVLVNTEFRTDALAGALSAHQSHDDVLRQRICRADTRRARVDPVIDPATVQTQPGEPRPKVAPSGPDRAADLGHHRRSPRACRGAPS